MTDRPEDKIDLSLEDLEDVEATPPPAVPPARLEISSDDLFDVPDEKPARAFPGLPPGGYPGGYPASLPMTKPSGRASSVSNVAQLTVAGALGGLLGWMLTEPFFNERALAGGTMLLLQEGLWFALICLCIGASFGVAEGLASRVWQKLLTKGAVGAAIGLVGGFLGGLLAQGVFGTLTRGLPTVPIISSEAYYRLMLARALGWGLAGCFAGIGQGVAIGSWRKALYGALGGFAGGFGGGLLFDPISEFTGHGTGAVSRGLAITVVGLCAGLGIGLVEEIRKQGWLLVLSGLLTGKQFILYREQTTLGSSPKSDIVLPKDPAVHPQHALLRTERDRYLLQDLTNTTTTLLNGQPVTARVLRDGDVIQIGGTTLAFRTSAMGKQEQ